MYFSQNKSRAWQNDDGTYYRSLLHSALLFILHIIRTFINRLEEVIILIRGRGNICPQAGLLIEYGSSVQSFVE